MSKLKKGLALVLTLCMMLSLLPVITPSAEATEGNDDFYKIVHLDCGRKYFTKDWIIALLHEMEADGFNQLQLAFGNDGLRFLLDDMSFTANGTTYSHDTVVSKVESGNKAQNSSGDSSWLKQSEMDEIISTANTLGIEIVPLLNLPGHANAILDIFDDAYNASGSNNTFDVTNEQAVNAATAIFQKYVDYFSGKGCKFFNFGADEYANDASGAFSFSRLDSVEYQEFVDFINSMAAYIKGKGMTPRAFNDGLYYNSQTDVSIDSEIQCCYWSSGWGSYPVAPASTISDKGHDMINTNGDFYYVLGKNDQFDSGSSYASNWDNAKFMGTTFDSEQAGSMFCIWCDYPNAETEDQIYTKVVTNGVLAAMSEAMGHMPENVTVKDEDTDVSITAPGLTSIDVTAQSAVTSGNTVSKTYSITLNGGDYTGKATVKIPYDNAFDGCVSFSGMVGTDSFDVNRDGDYFVATVPHFSDVTITGTLADTGDDPLDTVTSGGGTLDSYVLDTDGLDADAQYLIVYQASSSATSGKALNTSKSSLDVTISDSKATPSGDASAALWTYKKESGWFTTSYYLINDSNYLYPSRSGRWNKYTYSLNIDLTKTSVNISDQGSGAYGISNSNSNAYVAYSNNAWDAQSSSQNLYFYKYTPGTASYKVEPDLQESRITALTVTNDGYTDDSWNAYENALDAATDKLSEVKNATYSSQNEATTALDELINLVNALETAKSNLKRAVTITINYQTEDGTIVKTETRKVAGDTTEIALSNVTGTDGKTYVPKNTSLSLVNGKTEYTVTVTEMPFDPSTVSPLTIEYWITNASVTANGVTSREIPATEACSTDGVAITNYAPETGYKTVDGPNRTTVYWQSRILDRTTAEQTEDNGDDETTSGSQIAYVRCNGSGVWQTSADRETWTTVPENYQLIAYYLMYAPLTDEVTTATKDWGFKSGESWGYTESGQKCVLSFQVVDESGTVFPADNGLVSSSWIYYLCGAYASGSRYLGFIDIMTGNSEYEVYKVTYTMGTASITGSSAAVINSLNYNVADNEQLIMENDDGLGDDITIDYTSGSSPQWTTSQNACLIRIYIKSKPSDDNLTVHYVDNSTGQDFHSYDITVKKDTLFDEGFSLDVLNQTLSNNTVDNNVGHTVVVSCDLSTMPTIDPAYRYSTYTCVRVQRSQDGKDVYLYYTFDNTHSFVVDFGLPLKITTDDLKISGSWTSASVSGAQYGTANATVGEGVTYTPTETLKGVETLNLTLTDSNGSVTHTIYIYPATTVYYEEGFATYEGNWTSTGSTGRGEQQTAKAGQVANATAANYGYDAAYVPENYVGPSNGTQATSSAPDGTKNYATFTFTGTGVDVYANCTTQEAKLMIGVYQGTQTDSPLQVISVNTKMATGSEAATEGQAVSAYNVPVASITGLGYGEYTLKIIHVKVNNSTPGGAVNLDGFRVYGTLQNQNHEVYQKDLEDNPTYIELRDEVLTAQQVNTEDSEYAAQIAGQVYSASNITQSGAIILSNNSSNKLTTEQLKDLLDNGPKNEIYLQKDQALVFKVTTDRVVQIGLKALDQTTSYTINNDTAQTLTSSTDMFYTLFGPSATETTKTVTITNKGDGILAVTKLKICDDPNAALGTLTADDLIPALVSLGFKAPEGDNGNSGTNTPTTPPTTDPGTETPTTPPTTDPGTETPTTPADPATGLPFTDVGPGDWFLENVRYVYEKGLMNGTSDTTFSPQSTTNRAMIVTILHRLEGTPAPGAQAPFTDVPAGQYYAEAVAWAAANGIVNGTSDTTFAPLNNITREQMAAILYRYAQYKNYDVSGSADLSVFTDAASISDYAVSALQWAVDAGLINGKGNGILDPKGSATRAEVSAILSRFCENIAG